MKRYNVIYADPPWSYKSKDVPVIKRSIGKVAIDYYYTEMTNKDIADLPIHEVLDKDAVCFLWVPVPLLPDGLMVLDKWGFKYKTMLTWHKTNSKGMGYWFRGYTEHILFGVRGDIKAFKCLEKNIFESKVAKHSQKPPYFRDLISRAIVNSIPNPTKLELFARSRGGLFSNDEYQGWDVFGNEVDNSINLTQPKEIKQ